MGWYVVSTSEEWFFFSLHRFFYSRQEISEPRMKAHDHHIFLSINTVRMILLPTDNMAQCLYGSLSLNSSYLLPIPPNEEIISCIRKFLCCWHLCVTRKQLHLIEMKVCRLRHKYHRHCDTYTDINSTCNTAFICVRTPRAWHGWWPTKTSRFLVDVQCNNCITIFYARAALNKCLSWSAGMMNDTCLRRAYKLCYIHISWWPAAVGHSTLFR